jgi:hypothetical protein
MLSQDEVLHNSPMLRSSKPFVPETRETGKPFLRDLVIASLFPIENRPKYQKQIMKNITSNNQPALPFGGLSLSR